jgi:uncharacterized protein (TIGR03083 family)
MPDVTDVTDWIKAYRQSHDRFTELVEGLDDDAIRGRSYHDWTLAQVASHLGSQAEIFQLFLDAGLSLRPVPAQQDMVTIWDEWNAMAPPEQVGRSVGANEAFVRRLEELPEEDRSRFEADLFGRRQDLTGLVSMKLGEHAVHTWDIDVALHPDAVVLPAAVALLVDTLPERAGRGGKPTEDVPDVVVETSDPDRRWRLGTHPEVSLTEEGEASDDALRLPAEAFLRLVYGRLDPAHTPSGVQDARLTVLREVFPGF